MSNLLDKSSIVLTPTAYDNSKVLCVKPSDGSGDFDFSRNSAATRVNAQGLVENVQILSSNLVQNGDFSQQGAEQVTNGDFANGTNNWVFTSGATLTALGAKITHTPTAGSIAQSSVLTIGKQYKLTYEITESISGGLKFNSAINTTLVTTVGVHTKYFEADGTTAVFARTSSSNNDVTITNISVKEVGQNWDLGTGFSIGEDKAVVTNSSNSNLAQVGITITNTKKYKINFTIDDYTSGSIKPQLGAVGAVVGTNVSANGTYTEVLTANNNFDRIVFRTSGTAFNGSITNISVIEITTDTNLPRINYEGFSYDGSGNIIPNSGCGSWLFEPQSTNLFTQSELFTDGSWDKTQTIIEAASITLPNGLTNGYKLFANTTLTSHWFEKTPFPTATTGQDYTLSLFVKSAGSDFIQIASSTGLPSKYQNFNISTGTKASGDISDSSITDFGNGWYRISVTETTTATTARYLIVPILSDVGRNAAFAGTANEDGVYIWGAMLEQNSFSTSYIPTEGSQVTRNQDLCTNGGSLASINSSEGVLYIEAAALFSGSNAQISLSDGTNDNGVKLRFDLTANRFTVFLRGNGGTTASKTVISSPQTNNNKIAFVWNATNLRIWINGTEQGLIATNDLPIGLNTLNFASNTGLLPFFGKTKALAVWKEALTDAELTALTTI